MDESLSFFSLQCSIYPAAITSCPHQPLRLLPPELKKWRPKARTRPGGKHGKNSYCFQLYGILTTVPYSSHGDTKPCPGRRIILWHASPQDAGTSLAGCHTKQLPREVASIHTK